jgi:hypothetical protein
MDRSTHRRRAIVAGALLLAGCGAPARLPSKLYVSVGSNSNVGENGSEPRP